MNKCGDCIHYDICQPYVEKDESFPEIKGGCRCFKNKADYAEVKHGKWKIKTDDYDCEYMMCSVCKEEFYPIDEDTVDTTPNYCPNCGAKMDGGSEDNDHRKHKQNN